MMADQMGWDEIKPEEIPPDPSHMCVEVQQALIIFQTLPDMFEGMSGMWLGKNFSGILDIMTIFGVEDYLEVMNYINVCRDEYFKYYENQMKLQSKLNETGS